MKYEYVNNNSMRAYKVSLFIIVLVVNLFYAVQLKLPYGYPDSFIPLSLSAFFSGSNWSEFVSNIPYYYGYGPALLYIPFFVIFDNSIYIYKAIMVLNSILVSLIPVIAYNILIKYLNIKNNKLAFSISLTVGLFPSSLILSKSSLNEIFFIVIPWITFYILLKESENKNKNRKIVSTIFLGLILVLGYVTHGRFIALIASVLIIVMIYNLKFKDGKVVYLLPLIFVLVSGIIIDYIFKDYLMNHLWNISNISELDNTVGSTINKLNNYNFKDIIKSSVILFISQVFYSQLATLSLIGIGIVLSIKTTYCIFKKKLTDSKNLIVFVFPFILFILSCFMAAIQFYKLDIEGTNIGSYYVYGRYMETILPIYLLVICSYLSSYKEEQKKLLNIAKNIFFITIFLFITIVLPKIINTNVFVDVNTIMTYTFSGKYLLKKSFDTFQVMIVVISCILIIWIIIHDLINKNRINLIFTIFICVSLYSYQFIISNIILTHSNIEFNYIKDGYETINSLGEIYSNYNDVYVVNDNEFVASDYQFLLSKYNIHNLKNSELMISDIKENSFIIIYYKYDLNNISNDFFLINSGKYENVYIWGYGDELYRQLNK